MAADMFLHQQQYGLSYQVNDSRNKTFIFVKLTDSALKSIEDYLSKKGNGFGKPKIQFQSNSNQGILSLPNESNEPNSESVYNFSLSNVDGDGPQGGFECLRHVKNNRNMESLGSMHYKMQIHASEDSYQKTKVKMAMAEKESKKNCTKVIKNSGPNVGRQVKVKKPANLLAFSQQQPGFHSNNNGGISSSSNNLKQPQSPPLLKVNGNLINNRINSTTNNHISGSISSQNSRSSPVNSPGNPELMKRPIRERVIHLLAVRPFKKPELIAKLNKDGIKDKDKKGLSLMLNQVASLKENAYHLARNGWQEVQVEDWPFYSPDDRDLVRRRNPLLTIQQPNQNISQTLSPLSSDSSCAQTSPSPPSLVNVNSPSPGSTVNKRSNDIYLATLKTKKPRISHQDANHQNQIIKGNIGLQTNGYHDVINGWANKPKSPDANRNVLTSSNTNMNTTSSVVSNGVTNSLGKKDPYWSSNSQPDLKSTDSYISKDHFSPDSNGMSLNHSGTQSQPSGNHLNGYATNPSVNHSNAIKKSSKSANQNYRNGLSNGVSNGIYGIGCYGSSVTSNANESVSSTPNSSPDSGISGSHDGLSTTSSRSINGDVPDYILKYTEIKNAEQRSRYKSDFASEYAEYRTLHGMLERIRMKFSDLEYRLKSTPEGSEEWDKINDEILTEYEEYKKNTTCLEARKRRNYLHEKLSHIKRLVLQYDKIYPRMTNGVKKNPRRIKTDT